MFINEDTWQYIRQHADDDVRKLALQGVGNPSVDLPTALHQIAGRQTAQHKLPSWAANNSIIYPPHLNMEQCSSEQTARYKAPHLNMEQCSSEQTARYKAPLAGKRNVYVDLTGGFGVDFYWMSQGFKKRIYVERDEQLCAISTENFRTLGHDCSVINSSAVDYLATIAHADVIYLDPARRNEHGGRTYSIEDCTPNVLELLPVLMQKADRIILKLSPMLDWRKAVNDLKHVAEVHIVSVNNECKELVLVLKENADALRVVCVNDDSIFEVPPILNHQSPTISQHPSYLYEPNASIMKAGCFGAVANKYGIQQIADNSHLFLSSDEIEDFPGRRFQITAISSMNKRELKEALKGMNRANIAVRNFPLSVDQLRKKLKLKDGGEVYLFATTMADGQHRLFICRKIG